MSGFPLPGVRGLILGALGRQAEARALLDDLRRQEEGNPELLATQLAMVHLGLGDLEGAAQVLAERKSEGVFFYTMWFLNPIRDRPEFQDVVRRWYRLDPVQLP